MPWIFRDANGAILQGASPAASGGTLPSADILVGNASNIAAAVAMSGDVGIDNAGVATIQPLAVTAGKIAASAVTEAKMLLADNATRDVSTSQHGFVPKATNVADRFLGADAAWDVPFSLKGPPSISKILGLLANTGQPNTVVASVSQTVQFAGIWLPSGFIASSIVICKNSVTPTGTNTYLGLYDSSGNLRAYTGDVSATLNSATNGFYEFSFTGGGGSGAYTIPSDGIYYCAFLQNGGTQPILLVVSTGASFSLQFGALPRFSAIQTGQASLPGPATLANPTAASTAWFGLK